MKRLVFIAGDGFSINFRRHLGIADQIVTHYLLPPPPHIIFRPRHQGDPPAGPLWREDVFEELWREWHRNVASECVVSLDPFERYRAFIRDMARIPAPVMKVEEIPLGQGPGFAFYTIGPNAELRSYLWHLFTEYDAIILAALKKRLGEPVDMRLVKEFYFGWEWGQIMQRLNNEFDCKYISFNYDLSLERVLSAFGHTIECPTSRDQLRLPLEKNSRLVLKPHGSINFFSDFGEFTLKNLPLHNFAFYCFPEGFDTWPRIDFQENRPGIVDVVPPGHSGFHHITNPRFDIRGLCADAVAAADAIVLCGLSAADPDTPEIDQLLSNASKACLAVHVGLDGDSKNDAANSLRKYCGHYIFVTANQGAKLDMPDALWEISFDSLRGAPVGEPRRTKDGILIDSVQTVGGTEVMPDGTQHSQGVMIMIMFMINTSNEPVKDGRFQWTLKGGEKGEEMQVPSPWMDLNFGLHQGLFDLKLGGRIAVPLLMVEPPLADQSKLFFSQDDTFGGSVSGNQIIIYPNVMDLHGMLYLIDGRGIALSSVEFVFKILRREETIRFQFRHQDEREFSTITWLVNKEPRPDR